jgi:hypothetical protein
MCSNQEVGADDGTRTRDPHLGKVMPSSAGDRFNRSRETCAAPSAGVGWNRSGPLRWSSRSSSKPAVRPDRRERAGRSSDGRSARRSYRGSPATGSFNVRWRVHLTGNVVISPFGPIRPIVSLPELVNQTFPSGPWAMSSGPEILSWGACTTVILPPGVIRPIRL